MPYKPYASSNYDSAKGQALSAIQAMTQAMKDMGAEHVEFHNHFADAQRRLENTKKAYGGKELDAEVIRSIALEGYLSEGNLPKVMAFGHMEMEKVLKDFEKAEMRLDSLQKETARRVEALLGNRDYECGKGQNAGA